VGQAVTGNLSWKAAFCGFSVSTLSQTNRPACFASAASVKT
jgi:hypothetical protein